MFTPCADQRVHAGLNFPEPRAVLATQLFAGVWLVWTYCTDGCTTAARVRVLTLVAAVAAAAAHVTLLAWPYRTTTWQTQMNVSPRSKWLADARATTANFASVQAYSPLFVTQAVTQCQAQQTLSSQPSSIAI